MYLVAINVKGAGRVDAMYMYKRGVGRMQRQGHTCPSFAAVSKSFSKPPRAALLCSRYAHDS